PHTGTAAADNRAAPRAGPVPARSVQGSGRRAHRQRAAAGWPARPYGGTADATRERTPGGPVGPVGRQSRLGPALRRNGARPVRPAGHALPVRRPRAPDLAGPGGPDTA